MKKLALFILLLSCLKTDAFSAASYGQASDLFTVGAGARSMAMGGAFTAISDDASAPYYNPAGLAYLDEHQLMGMYAPLYLNTNYSYLATANPFGDKWGAVALSGVMLRSSNFEQRSASNHLESGDLTYANSAITASYARKIFGNLSAGANAKILQQKAAGYSGSALGFDLGFLYKPFPLLNIGLNFENINSPEVTLKTEGDTYRPLTKFGLSSQVFRNLLLSLDMMKTSQQQTLYAAGLEFNASKLFDVRAGYSEDKSFTAGAGLKLKNIRLDYAFSDTDLGAFNKVSFTWAWHNIYTTEIAPPLEDGRSVYALSGFENEIAFVTKVPNQSVARWSLTIKNQDGGVVRVLSADLRPPEKIVWDAKTSIGEPVVDGTYNYTFLVEYRNGKSWTVDGQLQLVLPKRNNDETIDMKLDLNGTKATETNVK